MKPETAIASAMVKAGINTAEHRLRQIALDALRKHHRNIQRALPTFERSIEGDHDLISEALRAYLARVDAEMLGGGHGASGTHCATARPQQPSTKLADIMPASASPSTVYRTKTGKFAPEPSKLQREMAALVATDIANSVFNTFKMRDGRGIGFVRWGELSALHKDDAVSAYVIASLMEHAQADPKALVKDVVKASELAGFIAKAKEVTRAL